MARIPSHSTSRADPIATVGWQATGTDCWACVVELGEQSTDSLVALLLLAPTAALAAVVRQNEPDITKKVQSRYRARLYLTGLSLFTASLVLGLDVQGWAMAGTLLGASILATLLAIRTAHSAGYSWMRIRRKSGRPVTIRRPGH